jgi:hypothetical protein
MYTSPAGRWTLDAVLSQQGVQQIRVGPAQLHSQLLPPAAACCLLPGPPSFTKVGEINLTNVGRLQGWVGTLIMLASS